MRRRNRTRETRSRTSTTTCLLTTMFLLLWKVHRDGGGHAFFVPVAQRYTTTTTKAAEVAARKSMMIASGYTTTRPFTSYNTFLASQRDGDDDDKKKKSNTKKKKSSSNNKKRKKGPAKKDNKNLDTKSGLSKQELVKAIGEQMRKKRGAAAAVATGAAATAAAVEKTSASEQEEQSSGGGGGDLLNTLNPYKAGQNLRKTIDAALTSIANPQSTSERQSIYLDGLLDVQSSPWRSDTQQRTDVGLDGMYEDDYVPEVLVVGATGEVGRLVVRRLLQENLRVRVLVRDLYSKTLNLLGTGVTYCQGDLSNMDSLEYALTDVDKIVFCASAPKPDEDAFQEKFQDFMKENLQQISEMNMKDDDDDDDVKDENGDDQGLGVADSDLEWERLETVLNVRAELAEQVDCIGMQNLVRAYQHVRHADYGTAQSAKRSLFRFKRMDDFNLFALDDEDEFDGEDDDFSDDKLNVNEIADMYGYDDDEDNDYRYNDSSNYDMYTDTYGDDDDDKYAVASDAPRKDGSALVQSQWVRNRFDHGVFVGRIPREYRAYAGGGGQAAIVSSRFRSRSDPDLGIDLGPTFYGLIVRACSDGGIYEAFIRTGAYYEQGIEYVANFSTETKSSTSNNKSRNKFTTIRLPFFDFRPVRRKDGTSLEENGDDDDESLNEVPVFRGGDVRNIGFRYRSSSNEMKSRMEESNGNVASFYLAMDYVKLYRAQPEPEFVYLSDSRIPPVVKNGMVSHQAKQLIPENAQQQGGVGGISLLDEKALEAAETTKAIPTTASAVELQYSRTPEETYYKYRGEEILKRSGLSYAILRVPGYNESPSGEFDSVDLKAAPENNEKEEDKDHGGMVAISRAEAAEVCVSALLEPSALNKSVYVSKKKTTIQEEDMNAKFSAVPTDTSS